MRYVAILGLVFLSFVRTNWIWSVSFEARGGRGLHDQSLLLFEGCGLDGGMAFIAMVLHWIGLGSSHFLYGAAWSFYRLWSMHRGVNMCMYVDANQEIVHITQ
jgi:hypothetical protein